MSHFPKQPRLVCVKCVFLQIFSLMLNRYLVFYYSYNYFCISSRICREKETTQTKNTPPPFPKKKSWCTQLWEILYKPTICSISSAFESKTAMLFVNFVWIYLWFIFLRLMELPDLFTVRFGADVQSGFSRLLPDTGPWVSGTLRW